MLPKRTMSSRPSARSASGAIRNFPPKNRAFATISMRRSCRPRTRPVGLHLHREARVGPELLDRAVEVELLALEVLHVPRVLEHGHVVAEAADVQEVPPLDAAHVHRARRGPPARWRRPGGGRPGGCPATCRSRSPCPRGSGRGRPASPAGRAALARSRPFATLLQVPSPPTATTRPKPRPTASSARRSSSPGAVVSPCSSDARRPQGIEHGGDELGAPPLARVGIEDDVGRSRRRSAAHPVQQDGSAAGPDGSGGDYVGYRPCVAQAVCSVLSGSKVCTPLRIHSSRKGCS